MPIKIWIPAFAGIIHGAGAPPQTMKTYFQGNDRLIAYFSLDDYSYISLSTGKTETPLILVGEGAGRIMQNQGGW